jgi:hypothetical protein
MKELTACSGVLVEKLVVAQLVKFTTFYGTEGSLPCSQKTAKDHYTEPDESITHPLTLQFYIPF